MRLKCSLVQCIEAASQINIEDAIVRHNEIGFNHVANRSTVEQFRFKLSLDFSPYPILSVSPTYCKIHQKDEYHHEKYEEEYA